MKKNNFVFGLIFLFGLIVLFASCITEKEIYQSASGEKELPDWRLLAKARESYGPYIKWKEALIRRLYTGSRMADTKKGRIEYAIYGDSGPYLLIMHGGPGGYDQAAALFGDMIGKGFRILTWSRPGYVRTPLEAGETYPEQADAAAALMDALGINRVAVLGYSAGGPPAEYFANRYPGRIWALILECAVTQTYLINPENFREKIFFGYLMYDDPFLWTSDITAQYAPRAIGMSTIGMESSLDKKARQRLMDHIMRDERRMQVLKDMIKAMSPGELRKKGMNNDLAQLAGIKSLPLKTIQTPTFIIHGSDDADVPLSQAKFAAGEISGSRLYVVPGGFHVMALTDTIDEITNRRLSFLKEHAPLENKRQAAESGDKQ